MSSVTPAQKNGNQTQSFENIINALSEYCKRLGVTDYSDCFIKFIVNEQLNDATLPIENELGEDCLPNYCVYTSINKDRPFPIPLYLVMPNEERETFMFYILQYSWKYNQCPSDEYIRTYLVPKISNCFIFDDLPLFLESGLIENIIDNDTTADYKDDFAMFLNQSIESQLQYSINEWNTKHKKTYYIDFDAVKAVFHEYNINYSYFQTKNNRKQFKNLLKTTAGVPKGASTRIWRDVEMFVLLDPQQNQTYDTSFIVDMQEIHCKDF